MISTQSNKSNNRTYSLSFNNLAAQSRNCDSPHSESSAERDERSKLLQMVTFLDQENQQLQNELARERQRRNEELSIIIKSLICMESKVKADKKLINQRLLKNDTEICRLICLNRVLQNKINDAAVTKDDFVVLEDLQCTTCKNKFTKVNTKENWCQTTKEEGFLNDLPTSELSSDDAASSLFNGARKCARYTSKRTFGTFRDYMHSRSLNIDDTFDSLIENASTISCDDSQKSYEKINTYSQVIDKLHSVQRVSPHKYDLNSECDNNSWDKNPSHSTGVETNLYFPDEANRVLSPYSSKTNSLSRSEDFLETSTKNNFEMSTDNWYASASDGEEDQSLQTNLYGYSVAVNPVLECVNQILLQQSMEEPHIDCDLKPQDGNNNKQIDRDQGNPVNISRKRVHFSTKNSMASVPRGNKGIKDSDQNNQDIPLQVSSQSKYVIADQIKDNILNYESIYSNEYEPIGSENNSSHLYVDMEAKLSSEDVINLVNKKTKQPPALPPKPANLLKFNKAIRENEISESEKLANCDDKSVLSEPDYCSISEVNPTATFVQVVADVHKEQHFETDLETRSINSDKQSRKTDDIEQIIASIPKLSTFSAIQIPKPTPSKTSYSIKPRHFEVMPKSQRSPRQFKRKNVPNILAEINKRMTYSFPSTISKNNNFAQNDPPNISISPNKSQTPLAKCPPLNPSPIEQDKHLPIQAEFDWYNLDVEYGKSSSNHPNIPLDSDKTKDVLIKLHGVEYNLDEEFSLAGSPDKINEIEKESLNTLIDPGSPKTVFKEFPIIAEPSPCFRIQKTASFEKFIDSSGLSTKPLPRQRKIYFAGPFV